MKKWFLIGICLLSCLGVRAQYGGDWVVGGRINYVNGGRIVTPDGERKKAGYSLRIAPSLAYFVRNGIAVGVGVGYEYMQDPRGHQNTGELMPFLRYDFGGGRARFFMQLESSLGWGKSKMKDGEEAKHFVWSPRLKPGIWVRITDHLAVEATISSLEYKHVKSTDLGSHDTLVRDKWKFRWLDISFGFAGIFRF